MGDGAAEVEAAAPVEATAGEKRSAATAELDEGGPETKVQETEAPAADAGGNDKEADAEGDEAAATAKVAKGSAASCFPVSLGPRTFDSVDTALFYFRNLAKDWPAGQLMNEFEHKVLSDLLKKCHPTPRSKIKDGVRAFKVDTKESYGSKCFHLIRTDGSVEDFSYLKCLSTVAGYDLVAALKQKGGSRYNSGSGERRFSSGGGRGGGGRGGGGRGGSGGRGGRRGRGRGRN